MKSLVFGISGQDGYFLTKSLSNLNHKVVGVFNSRRANNTIPSWSNPMFKSLTIDYFDVKILTEVINTEEPDVIYNLAGFSSVRKSFLFPHECLSINLVFYDLLLTALGQSSYSKSISLIQCSSSEMFAGTKDHIIDENSIPIPISPYGISKAAAHYLSKVHRESFGIRVSNAILFNHESEFRKDDFFFSRATTAVLDFYYGKKERIEISTVAFERDWSFAGDVAEALAMMSKSIEPSDYVIASGNLRSGRDFFQVAFSYLGIKSEIDDIVISKGIDRPLDHKGIAGNPTKIERNLGWSRKLTFEKLVERVIEKEIARRTST